MITIVKNTTNTAQEVCSFVYNLKCGNGDVNGHRWHLKIPGGKPPIVQHPVPKVKNKIFSSTGNDVKKKIFFYRKTHRN